MSEYDFPKIEKEQEFKTYRNIKVAEQKSIANDIRAYLAKGNTIEQVAPSSYTLTRKKRTSADNTHLFRSKENATHH